MKWLSVLRDSVLSRKVGLKYRSVSVLSKEITGKEPVLSICLIASDYCVDHGVVPVVKAVVSVEPPCPRAEPGFGRGPDDGRE